MKRNFGTGKKLLVAAVLLSVNLVIQLFTVAETVDSTNGVLMSVAGATQATSYIITAASMIIVLQEFFQIKKKMRGLLALNALLERKPSPIVLDTEPVELDEQEPIDVPPTDEENNSLDSIVLDEDAEFDSLLDELDEEERAFDDIPGNPSLPIMDKSLLTRYSTTKLKIDDETGDVEPLLDDSGLQDLIEQADLAVEEDKQLAKIVAESEIIQTLNELETIVQELKAKQN